MSIHILVADDEKELADVLALYLASDGYTVHKCRTSAEALDCIEHTDLDLAILDVMFPDGDGFQICRKIREKSYYPVIMLTARAADVDKIMGLTIGADDYITKPFSMEELVFRIEAILRRVKGKKGKEITMYKIGKFTFDTQKQVLLIDDKVTKLTTKESELLSLLCAHVNEILERNLALRTIWIDDNYFNARSMDVYITKLRKHLKDDPSIEIINIHGKGYKLIAPELESAS